MKDRELEEIKEIYATMQRVDFIEKLTNVAEGLKGEVERLSFERDNALSLRDVAVKHHANLIQQVETYRKALEEVAQFKKGEALVYVSQIKDIARKALGESS